MGPYLGSFNNRALDLPFQFPAKWTAFDGVIPWGHQSLIFATFSQEMRALTTTSDIIVGGAAVQHYFADPASPFALNPKSMVSISQLGPKVFATRFAQLLNTYWLAITGRNVVSMRRSQNFSILLNDPDYNIENILSTTSQRTRTDLFICDNRWLAVLIIADLAVLFAGVASLILSTISKGPHLALSISTMLREAQYTNLPEGGTTLDDKKRGRLLKNIQVKFVDVDNENRSGSIGIGTYDQDGHGPKPLAKKTLYR